MNQTNTQKTVTDFLSLEGPFAVVFSGADAICHVVETAEDVLALLRHSDGGGFDIEKRETVLRWLHKRDYWRFDNNGEPYSWDLDIGELSHVSVVKVSPWRTSDEQPDPRGCCHAHSSTPAFVPQAAQIPNDATELRKLRLGL